MWSSLRRVPPSMSTLARTIPSDVLPLVTVFRCKINPVHSEVIENSSFQSNSQAAKAISARIGLSDRTNTQLHTRVTAAKWYANIRFPCVRLSFNTMFSQNQHGINHLPFITSLLIHFCSLLLSPVSSVRSSLIYLYFLNILITF